MMEQYAKAVSKKMTVKHTMKVVGWPQALGLGVIASKAEFIGDKKTAQITIRIDGREAKVAVSNSSTDKVSFPAVAKQLDAYLS